MHLRLHNLKMAGLVKHICGSRMILYSFRLVFEGPVNVPISLDCTTNLPAVLVQLTYEEICLSKDIKRR